MKIQNLLKNLGGNRIFYKPNPGNGGDALIASATFQFFSKHNIRYEIITDSTNLKGEVVLFGGGGNLIPHYIDCENFIKNIHKDVKALILLPHTIAGHSELLSELKDNVYIYCRELQSYEYVKKIATHAHVFLEHDMAVSLDAQHFINNYSTFYPYKIFLKQLLKKIRFRQNPLSFKCLNAFRSDVEKTSMALPDDNIDVSSAINYSYQMTQPKEVNKTTGDIFKLVSFYKTVNTNRLHIAIAATILGKKVKFYPNSYYKNAAVYEYSLRDKPNIEFIE